MIPCHHALQGLNAVNFGASIEMLWCPALSPVTYYSNLPACHLWHLCHRFLTLLPRLAKPRRVWNSLRLSGHCSCSHSLLWAESTTRITIYFPLSEKLLRFRMSEPSTIYCKADSQTKPRSWYRTFPPEAKLWPEQQVPHLGRSHGEFWLRFVPCAMKHQSGDCSNWF